jgi:HTH-type transcriptional regulator/antitoxin HigA
MISRKDATLAKEMPPLKTLCNDREHAEAVRVLARLLGRPDGRLSAGERDYIEVLGRLMEEYANRKYPVVRRKYPPLDMVKFLMGEHQMTTSDLGRILGSMTAASLVLNGKRQLSKAHIRKLAARFKVDGGLFL